MTETWTYDLFISYAQANRDWVEGYLLDAIEKAEVRYTSESAFTLGVPRILEFERAIRQSRFTLLVISEAYLADDLTRFIDILAQSYGEQVGTWPVIPLILDEGLKLPARLKMLEGLKASSSEQWESGIERLCNQLQRPLPSPSVKPLCPYPGMLPFTEHDEERFFGRDDEIEELLGKLRLNPFLTVIGSSGSGKSSLVFAGLIPRLKQSGLFGTGQWCIRSFRPGTNPLANLQTVLGIDTSTLEIQIQQLLSSQSDVRRLLLVVDQFEELFTQKSTNLIVFQQTLLKLVEMPNVYLILTVRADFYADLMGSLLWSEIHSHNFNVLPLDEKGLREAIVRPAEGVEVYIDSALVERLLVDAQGEPGVLPLIQETLVLLWEKLERHFLPLKSYELLVLPRPAYGATPTQPRTGLQVAITYRADAALAGLETEEKKAIARRIFLRLIQFGEGRPDTRRQQLEEDLRSYEDNSLQFNDTLEYLASSTRRLLTFSGEEGDQKRKVDIAHEALILSWPTLQEWISELRNAEKTRRRLEDKAQEWLRLEKKGGLLDEAELPEAENWLSSNEAKILGYGQFLCDLIATSRETVDKLAQQKEQQRQRELKLIQDKLKTARLLNWTLGIGFALVLGLTTLAISQTIIARLNTLNALVTSSEKLSFANKKLDALIEAIRAMKLIKWTVGISDSERLKYLLILGKLSTEIQELNSFSGHNGLVSDIIFSPDGSKLASASVDETVKLWNLDKGFERTLIESQGKGWLYAVSFSKDNKLIALGGKDGLIKLCKPDGTILASLQGHKDWVLDVRFSPIEDLLASASKDGTIKLWKPLQGKYQLFQTLKGHTDSVLYISFSDDGKYLASASADKTIKIWTSEGKLVHTLKGHTDTVSSVNFSPDGNSLISGSLDGTIKLWNKDGTELKIEFNDKDTLSKSKTIFDVRFSPDGNKIISASDDNSIRLWNRKGDLLRKLEGHNGAVHRIRFSPMDSHIFVSGSFDGTVKLWSDNLPFQGHQGSVTSISLSPDLQKLVSSSLDGTVKLWKRDGSLIKSLTDPEQSVDPLLPVNSVSFSSKGNIIVAAGNDQFLRIWDGNGNFLKRKKTDQTAITKVIVNSNGEKIVSASQDKMIKLWNLTDNLPLYTLLHEDSVNDVSFNFDETELVSASSDGIIKIWNLNNGALVSQSQKQKSEFVNAIFSPNGKVVISIDEKGTLIIFERKGQLLKIRKSEIIKGNIINIGAIPDSNLFILIKDNGSIEIRDFQGNLLQSTSITHRKIQKNSNFLFNRLLVAMPNFQNSLDLWNLNTDDLINQNCQKLKKYFESQSINEKNEEEKHKTCSS